MAGDSERRRFAVRIDPQSRMLEVEVEAVDADAAILAAMDAVDTHELLSTATFSVRETGE